VRPFDSISPSLRQNAIIFDLSGVSEASSYKFIYSCPPIFVSYKNLSIIIRDRF